MLSVIVQNLAGAFSIALSPVILIAGTVFLLRGNRMTAVGYVLGWFVGVAAAIGVFYVAGAQSGASNAATRGVQWGAGILAAIFLYFAYTSFKNFPHKGEEPEEPKWMSRLREARPIVAFGLALVLLVTTVKNFPVYVQIALSVHAAKLDPGQTVGAIVILSVLASSILLFMTILAFFGGVRGAQIMESIHHWLVHYNNVIMFVVWISLGLNSLSSFVASLGL